MPAKHPGQPLTKRQEAQLLVQKRIRKAVLLGTGGVLLFVAVCALAYFLPRMNAGATKPAASATPGASETAAAITKNADYARADDPIATITMADGSVITVELYPAAAPNTVANFIELSNAGFYDGLTFHRVIEGFMIQGGDPTGSGSGGPGYTVKGEFTANGVDNRLTHAPGVISMARTDLGYDTAGSQFFIVHGNAAHLDGAYAAFGEVTGGMEVVNAIAGVEVGPNDKPVEGVVIQSITVDTRGADYSAEKIQD